MAKEKLTVTETAEFLKQLLPRIRPHWKALTFAVVLLLLSTAIGLVFPLVVRNLLDEAFFEAGSMANLNRIAIVLILLFLLQAFFNFGQSYLTASVSERVVADVRKDTFRALVWQPPGYFAVRRVGEISSRIASDAGLIQNVLRFGIPELARQAIFLVGAGVIVWVMNRRLTLVALVSIPFAIGVAWFFGRTVRRLSRNIQDKLASAIAHAEQVFGQIRTVQSFTREEWEADQFGEDIDTVRDEGLRRAVARATMAGAVTFAAFGAIVLVIWEGGRLVMQGELTAGTLVAFLLYAVTIAGAIGSLTGFWSNLQEAAGAVGRILDIIHGPRELDDPPHPVPLPTPVRGDVRYEDVRFRYRDDLPLVLDGVSFEARPGETVALVGSSGVGKTTTASLLPRFFDLETGRVLLDGVDVRDVRLSELRGAIGLVPQEPTLFAGTLRENLLYGREDATEEEMIEAAKDAHAHDFISVLPKGYDALVGERGVTLSAGQRQRVAIARVMLKRPPVLILDEASSSLDAESERLVQDALERLMEGRTTLVIAHRLSTVIRADRIVVLQDGEIEDEGKHMELLERSPTYERLYRRQFEDALATTEGAGAP